MTTSMDLEQKNGQMELIMKDSIRKEKNMEMANICGKMALNLKEIESKMK